MRINRYLKTLSRLSGLFLMCSMIFQMSPLEAGSKAKKHKKHCLPLILPAPHVKPPEKKKQIPPLIPVSRVILDPGHGGEDLGAKSLVPPIYSEKNFNLVTARFVRDQLLQKGYSPVLTRTKDLFVTLADRALLPQLCNHDIFVSIHFNAASSPQAEGIEVFYYLDENHLARSQASKALAESVLKSLIKETNAKSRGVKHGNYYVIRETNVPAILIEGGFLTHPEELAKIKDPDYLKKISWGVTQGIERYLKSRDQVTPVKKSD